MSPDFLRVCKAILLDLGENSQDYVAYSEILLSVFGGHNWDAMMQGKQAKILSPTQERIILRHLETTHYPWRDWVIFLLSIKAGLRAKEIASLTWAW